ncbi:MAG: ABC transporter ATP-binding protein [Octadecabacter sp.]|nr:ABC transporter ATP-binding protein [Octadecabacter sp.]
MNISDRIFRPFEHLVRPFNLPLRTLPTAGVWSLIWHFAQLFRGILVAVAGLSVISAGIGLAMVWALAFVVDGVTVQGAAPFVANEIWVLAALVFLFAVVDPVVTFVRGAFMAQTVQVLLPAAMQWQAHKAVEGQDVAFFEDVFAGQVASRIVQVTSAVKRSMMIAMQMVPRVIVSFGGAAILLAALSPMMALPVVIWIALNIILAWFAVPVYAARSRKVAAATSRATGAMTDVYSNIAMVKLFAAEDSEAGAIQKVIGETIDTQHRENRAYVSTDALVHLLNVSLVVSIFAVGLWGLISGFVSLGDFVAGATIARTLSASSGMFIGLGQSVSRAYGTIADAMPIMTTTPTLIDTVNAPDLNLTTGQILFDHVTFGYGKTDAVVCDLSLSIAAGERVALVGLSGAGKSTLVSLLMRLRDVDAGRVTVDGQNVRDVTQTSLREQIGVVTQDIGLLHRSIRDNIRYGRPNATDSEVKAAAESAQAMDFIQGLHDDKGRIGLDAFVGDKGVKLSGGQRQRVTIARALLKDAPILVLDEATSALDSEAEAAIQENLDLLMAGKTTLAIAHRLSTIAAMDRIVVMDAGQIVEQGTHDTLLTQDGLYARLWARQSGGFLARKEVQS